MRTTELGRTGLQVAPVSFGTGSLGEMYGRLDEADALRLIDEAIDAGITLFDTSPYYGSAERRLGKALTSDKRDRVIVATKAGRYGFDDFDFSPRRIRESLENSLRVLGTDHVDVFQLHDIEFVPLGPVLEDGLAELERLKDAGKARFIGMTGYPVATFLRVLRETSVDVVLVHNHGNLLDDAVVTDLLPVADERGVGVMNAAAVALGMLTPRGSALEIDKFAPPAVQAAGRAMARLAAQRGVDIALIANQYALQRVPTPTTVVGVGKSHHLQDAIAAATTPLDDELVAELLALRPAREDRSWRIGLDENR